MSNYVLKDREWIVTGWAAGQMETEREDDCGNKQIVIAIYVNS